MFIIKYKKLFISISVVLVLLSVASIAFFGIRWGIDFTGGSQLEVTYQTNVPTQADVAAALKSANIESPTVQAVGDTGFVIKTRALTQAERESALTTLKVGHADATEKSFTTIGPSVGKELARKSIIAMIAVILGIVFYIAYSFHRVSKPVSSWAYGLIAIVTLLHDVVIPTGIFVILSKLYAVDVDTLFVVALLTILGLSVSDTIVVFDRIRENLRSRAYDTFQATVGNSINQTFTRSINTSATVILVLLSLVFFGPTSTKIFALMLASGMFFGTYSSIFLASPLLVLWENLQKKKKE